MDSFIKNELEQKARIIRQKTIEYSKEGYTYHFGGSFSATEILTYLYFRVLDSDSIGHKNRDKILLSKGHACVPMYVIFSMLGCIDEAELNTYKGIKSRLQAHPDMNKLTYIDFSSGSLGQGLSIGVGMAIANKLKKNDHKIHVILGDGECDEGQVWEAAMAASKYKLDNMICFLDYNKLQVDGSVEEIMPMVNVVEKWKSFGWYVLEVDGHDFVDIDSAYEKCKTVENMPKIIIANTVKGKGVSFMENKVEWHSMRLDKELKQQALIELKE
ncbi:MAG: transketolase [Bacillota bacterium]|nr:transketolase [Bacillota bacterium]